MTYVASLLCAGALVAAPALSFDLVARQAPAGEPELAAAAELAAAESLLAGTGGRLREPVTLGLAAGPRRAENGDGTYDLTAELELPLLAGGAARDQLAAAVAEARRVLPAAARAETLLDLRLAWADAWLAEHLEALRRDDLDTVERWLGGVRERVAAGADPPYEADLVALEAEAARFALLEAAAGRRAAWGALAALAALAATPGEPVPLADPDWRPEAGALDDRAGTPAGALLRAAVLRAALDAAADGLTLDRERSRWDLRTSVEREGKERSAHLGVALGLPRPGEVAAARAARTARADAGRRRAEIAAGRLAARFDAARALWRGLEEAPGREAAETPGEPGWRRPLAAIERRLAEGASRPTEALLVRRQLLAAREAALRRHAVRARAAAELIALTEEVTP
jgi:hypothetical protein